MLLVLLHLLPLAVCFMLTLAIHAQSQVMALMAQLLILPTNIGICCHMLPRIITMLV